MKADGPPRAGIDYPLQVKMQIGQCRTGDNDSTRNLRHRRSCGEAPWSQRSLVADTPILRALTFGADLHVEGKSEILRLGVGLRFELHYDIVAVAFRNL